MPLQHLLCRFFLLCSTLLCAAGSQAFAQAPQKPARTVSVALLSDPHFDPFRDPSKVKRLDTAPATAWKQILSEPAAPDATEAYQKLQAACGQKGLDADNDLLQSALTAAAGEPGTGGGNASPAFVVMAGDLVVHQFDCRYRKLVADSAPGLSRFAEKTIAYVALQLHDRFPHTPVYIALGNNDSGCGDYQLDANSPFLRNTSEAVAQGWVGIPEADRRKAIADYRAYGGYSLPLPAPMEHSRILAFDDLFLSTRYTTCDGKADAQNATRLLTWLQGQLADAKAHHEHVWLLAHIPTGVNTYATFLHSADVCGDTLPDMFLSSASLDRLLLQYAGTIQLFVTGHTHLDELHLEGHEGTAEDGVVMKTIPSISPISNNPPSFLTGTVDPPSATLLDYRLHTASASTGTSLQWSVAYDFQQAYNQPSLTPATISTLLQRFSGTRDDAAVENYQAHMASGLRLLALKAMWPQYVCGMQHSGPTAFKQCVCDGKSANPATDQRAK